MAHDPSAEPVFRSFLHRYLVAMALVGVGDEELAGHAADELVPLAPVDSLPWAIETQPEAWAAAWAIGAFHAQLGDTLAGMAYRDALRELGPAEESTVPLWSESLASDLESRLAARRGDEAAALEAAQRAYDLWVIHNPDEGGWYPEPGIRFHLARRLDAAGRGEDAVWYYRSFLPPHWTSFYTVLSQEAVSAEAGGQPAG